MKNQVVITGIGLLSGLGEGGDVHWQKLTTEGPSPVEWPVVDAEKFAPYPVHPLNEVDFSTQIPKKGDLRQMEPWQRIGTFTAGLALARALFQRVLKRLGVASAADHGGLFIGAAGNLQQVESVFSQPPGNNYTVIKTETSFLKICRIQFCRYRKTGANRFPDRANNTSRQSRTILQRPSPLVIALVN